VDDLVTGRGRHSIIVRWHLAPGSRLRLTAGGAEVSTSAGEFQVTVAATGPTALTAETAQVATGFGRSIEAAVLTAAIDAALPARVSTGWRRAGEREETA
jgi:Heparinase II/III-like protein